MTANIDDMSNLFRFFRMPTDLYEQWSRYATHTNQTLKQAMTELLHSVSNLAVPAQSKSYFADMIANQHQVQPKAYKQHLIKQFHFKYTSELKQEIFTIFQQTGYKNGTMEMDIEICTRLDYALKIKANRGLNTLGLFIISSFNFF